MTGAGLQPARRNRLKQQGKQHGKNNAARCRSLHTPSKPAFGFTRSGRRCYFNA
jgi:hypothetical protein